MSIGGIHTSHLRWAHGKFFQQLSTGDIRVRASYLILTEKDLSVRNYFHLGDVPVTTMRHTWDYHPVRPVRAYFACFEGIASKGLQPFARFVFEPDVCVAEVTVQ